ncbi:g3811 [Coccomyxa viridis]|uniref:G3811 protein n=1 Tax=Coccomyxa viridis TaxID=1274662 RepID=A0ABP1FVV0_9CHLO
MGQLSKAERDLLQKLMKAREGRDSTVKQSKGHLKASGGVKKVKAKKGPGAKRRAKDLVDQFGLCPISLQVMRRPVLPSSGQAYDEVNIARFSAAGKAQCPVSGAPLECHRRGPSKGKVMLTPDYALRNVIRHQAQQAKVYIAPVDKEDLLKQIQALLTEPLGEDFAMVAPALAKAAVDDTFLGYVRLSELQSVMDQFAEVTLNAPDSKAARVFPMLVAECLACREPGLINTGIDFLAFDAAWNDGQVVQEALSVGQDPDCRGKVLTAMEAKFKNSKYGSLHVKGVLGFDTESVPVQQFQARCADHILQSTRHPLSKSELQEALNVALRVRDSLSGIDSNPRCPHDLWASAMAALKSRNRSLDAKNVDRLFGRDNRQVLASLAGSDPDLLHWHLMRQHGRALKLCIEVLGEDPGYDDPNCGMYSEDEEDFIGSDEEDDEDREAYNMANWQHTHPDWAARPALAVPHLVHVRRRS